MNTIRIDLPVLLPEVSDGRDACVERVEHLLNQRRGVKKTHVVEQDGKAVLCVHYDPDVLTLDTVQRLVEAAGVEVRERYGHRVWPLRAVAGEDAGRRVEDTLRSVEGVVAVSANLAAQAVRVEFERSAFRAERVEEALRAAGLLAAGAEAKQRPWYVRNRELAWSLVAGALLVSGFFMARGGVPEPVVVLVYLGSYVFGAFDLVRHALGTLRQGRFTFDIELLMLLAAIGAALLGEWAEGAFLLFLFSLAHALEHYALGRARESVRALADLAPPMARVRRGQEFVETPVENVKPDDVVMVRPAERIPVDGRIQDGRSAVNQAPITGESVPVDKYVGDDVFAGTINGEGVLLVSTTGAVGDRTLDRVMKLVEEAQTAKAPTQVFTERFERVFVPVVLVADLALMVIPASLGLWDWSTGFYRAMALLVASSPCALALGTPASVLAGVAQAARRGVLIKGGVHLENLGTIRALALDKTGTLTVGQPEVTDLVPMEGVSARELLIVAAAVERQSQHPLAQAVVRRAGVDDLPVMTADAVQSVTGRGIRARVDGRDVAIGNPKLFEEDGITFPEDVSAAVSRLRGAGRSVMLARRDEEWLGVIGVADQPRAGVRDVLERIRALGVNPIVMLTGDHKAVGEAVSREVGIDLVLAELMPDDKVSAVRRLYEEHGPVAMVGDGVNDAPALAQATVGIAMGGAGTAAALETADVALMADDLGRLPFAIGLSREARAIIRQNLLLSLAVIAGLIVVTTTGVSGIGVAVIAHEGSTLIVIANALRLLRYER